MGSHHKTLPPIVSAPVTGRQRESAIPRKLSTAPGMAETTLKESERPHYGRTNSTPPGLQQFLSGPSTRQTVKTEGEVTFEESIGTENGRGQQRADRQINSEDGFFMTQVTCLCSKAVSMSPPSAILLSRNFRVRSIGEVIGM